MSKPDSQLKGHQRVFRFNMIMGFLVTVLATFMIVTGQYESLQSRQTSEMLLGWAAIVGLLYMVGFWFACMFRQQIFSKPGK